MTDGVIVGRDLRQLDWDTSIRNECCPKGILDRGKGSISEKNRLMKHLPKSPKDNQVKESVRTTKNLKEVKTTEAPQECK